MIGFLCYVIALPLLVVIDAYICVLVWAWIAVPMWHVEPLTMWQAYGLGLLVSAFAPPPHVPWVNTDKLTEKQKIKLIAHNYTTPLWRLGILLIMSWLAKGHV